MSDPANSNSLYNVHGKPNRHSYFGVRDGILIKVVYEPATQRIVTAHPVGTVDSAGTTVHGPTGLRINPTPKNPGTPAPHPGGQPGDYEP